jgi:head-tail adaptor
MRAGRLNERISIMRSTSVPDGGGGETQTWAEAGQRWGAFKPVDARVRAEQVSGGAQVAPTGGVVTLRADTLTRSLSIDDVLEFAGRSWNVREVQPATRYGSISVAVESE